MYIHTCIILRGLPHGCRHIGLCAHTYIHDDIIDEVVSPFLNPGVKEPFEGYLIAACLLQKLTQKLLREKNSVPHVDYAMLQAIELCHAATSVPVMQNLCICIEWTHSDMCAC